MVHRCHFYHWHDVNWMSTVLETQGGSSPVLGGGAVLLKQSLFVFFPKQNLLTVQQLEKTQIRGRRFLQAGRWQISGLKPETWLQLGFPKTTKSPTIKLPNPLAVPVGMSKDPCHERSDLLMQDFGIFQPSTFRDLGQRLIFLASRGSSATINARPLVDDSEKWIRFPTQKLAIWWCVWSPL